MTAPRIVLLDNDPFSLGAIHAPLIDRGYRIFRCRPQGLAEAHAVVKRAGADLVILDRWLARRADGWAFLGRLYGDRTTAHIPAIIAHGAPDLPPSAADLTPTGRYRVMAKPFDTGELREAIAVALGLAPPLHPAASADLLTHHVCAPRGHLRPPSGDRREESSSAYDVDVRRFPTNIV